MIYGIDVSKYQKTIDWPKVKAAGKDFAVIRLGWVGNDGRIVANGGVDPMFESNVKGAISAGLDVGVYVYSYCKTAEAAKVAAKETLELIRDYAITYPVCFDIEDAEHTGMTKAQNTAIADAFLSTIESAGYYSMLYTYKSFALSSLNMSELARYDFWLAHYATATDYTGNYGIWQYAGNTGRCDGVSTSCDLNIAYKDYASIIKAAGLNGFSGDDAGEIIDDLEEEKKQCKDCARLELLEKTLVEIREKIDAVL